MLLLALSTPESFAIYEHKYFAYFRMDDRGAAEEKKGVSIITGDDCGNGNDDDDDDDCRNSNFSYFSTDFPRNSYGLAFGLLPTIR